MKNLLWFVCLGLVCLGIVSSSSVFAQEAKLLAPRSDNSLGVPFSEPQTQRESVYPYYETPQQLVFRNAALRGAQRRERMAINAFFGYSPSRPPASPVPFMGSPIEPPTAYRGYALYPGFVFPRPYSRF